MSRILKQRFRLIDRLGLEPTSEDHTTNTTCIRNTSRMHLNIVREPWPEFNV